VIGFELDGGDAEYIAVPEVNLRALPDDLTFEQGVLLTDALGTPFHAAKKAEIQRGELVGVSGVGPLGIMCILSVAHCGGVPVAIDVIEDRLRMAQRFGAAHTVNGRGDVLAEISAITGGKGLDKVLDCSGSAVAIRSDLKMLRCRGILVQVGVCTEITLNLFDELVTNELIIKGSRNFHDTELSEMMDLIRTTPQINDVFTHRFTFDQADQAFGLAAKREGLKIILGPDEGSKA
jgi:propanol-preferring alcohol dehydrogenase